MTTRIALGFLASTLVLGCATLHPAGGGGTRGHGAIATYRPAVRAIVRGPVALRAYADSSGGRVFFADDCDAPVGAGAGREVRPNRPLALDVPAGTAACLATAVRRPFELLWRARTPRPLDVAAVAAR